jgi:serine/threonine protein kinase
LGLEYDEDPDLFQPPPKWKPIPESDFLNYVTQIVAAVKRIHDAGIIHRNLKSDNIGVI